MKSKRQLNHRDEGFSLAELVIAMLIIAIILTSLVAVQIRSVQAVTEARKFQQATALANEAIEQMRAIPWPILSQGNAYNFLTASGGDPLVVGNELHVDGREVRILIAAAGNQDLSQPWLPLFDREGSHKQTKRDASLAGTEFTVKAYVTEGIDGDTGTLGIAAVVEWLGGRSEIRRTVLWSSIYPSGCRGNDTQPYLAACQPYFDGTASSGYVTASVSANDGETPPEDRRLVYPGGTNYHFLTVRTVRALATLRSEQADVMDSKVEYGGTEVTSLDETIDPLLRGFHVFETRASTDITKQTDWPRHVGPIPISAGLESERVLSPPGSSFPITFFARADSARNASQFASADQSCRTGIFAGESCAQTQVNSSATVAGTGYLALTMAANDSTSTALHVLRRTTPSANSDVAWVGRFAVVGGASSVGCEALAGAGCVAAGAERTASTMQIGKIGGAFGTWNGDAGNGIVQISGGAGCMNYTDSVRIEIGPGQMAEDPVAERCGTLALWRNGGYETHDLDYSQTPSLTALSDTVTWTSGDGSIVVTAFARVAVTNAYIEWPTSPNCQVASCHKAVEGGNIDVTLEVRVEWGGGVHALSSLVAIVGPTARVTYDEPGSL